MSSKVVITNYYLEKYFVAGRIAEQSMCLDMSAKDSHRLARILNACEMEARIYLNEKRKLVEKYANKDDEGKIITTPTGGVDMSNRAKFDEEFNELLELEIQLTIDKIKFDFDKCKMATPETMLPFAPFFDEDDD